MNLRSARFAVSLVSAAMLVGFAGSFAGAEPPKDDHKKSEHKEAPRADKAKAQGVMVGDTAPDFKLKDTDGKEHSLADLRKDGKIVVIQWFNPDCPFVKKHYGEKASTFSKMADSWKGKKVVMIGINSGATGKQGAGIERNQKAAKDWKLNYPILLDESGTVGKAYGSRNTPAMYVIGTDGKIAYMGAIDDNDSPSEPGKTNYVTKAVDELLAGKPVTTASTKPYGCSVKYND